MVRQTRWRKLHAAEDRRRVHVVEIDGNAGQEAGVGDGAKAQGRKVPGTGSSSSGRNEMLPSIGVPPAQDTRVSCILLSCLATCDKDDNAESATGSRNPIA